jgi:hypothetical protein
MAIEVVSPIVNTDGVFLENYRVDVSLEQVCREIGSHRYGKGLFTKFSFTPSLTAPQLSEAPGQKMMIIGSDKEGRYVYVDYLCPAGQRVYDDVLAGEILRAVDSRLLPREDYTPIPCMDPYGKLTQAVGLDWKHKDGIVLTLTYERAAEPKEEREKYGEYLINVNQRPESRFSGVYVQGKLMFGQPLRVEDPEATSILLHQLMFGNAEHEENRNVYCDAHAMYIPYPIPEALEAALSWRDEIQGFIDANRGRLTELTADLSISVGLSNAIVEFIDKSRTPTERSERIKREFSSRVQRASGEFCAELFADLRKLENFPPVPDELMKDSKTYF